MDKEICVFAFLQVEDDREGRQAFFVRDRLSGKVGLPGCKVPAGADPEDVILACMDRLGFQVSVIRQTGKIELKLVDEEGGMSEVDFIFLFVRVLSFDELPNGEDALFLSQDQLRDPQWSIADFEDEEYPEGMIRHVINEQLENIEEVSCYLEGGIMPVDIASLPPGFEPGSLN